MPESLDEALLTASYRAAKQWRWRSVWLYHDRIEMKSRGLSGSRKKTIHLSNVRRADLVPKHGTSETILVLRLDDGSKEKLGVPGQALWQAKINEVLGLSALGSDRPLPPHSPDEAADAA